MSGRAYIYGLGAAGEAGVARAIEIMRNELDITMALIGVKRVADINRDAILGWPLRQPYEKV
jgi:L-lactate dehydrogenase (cytochrome)